MIIWQQGLHADKLESCKLDCKIPVDTSTGEIEKEVVLSYFNNFHCKNNFQQLQADFTHENDIEPQQSESDALQPADSSSIHCSFFLIFFWVFLGN